MGSTGSGSFSDYPRGRRSQGSQGGGQGSDHDEGNDCSEAIVVELEDVAQCDYYSNHNNVPSTGAQLKIGIRTRILALDQNGMTVGILPTKYNYLFDCIQNQGFSYAGFVTSSSSVQGMPRVYAEFQKIK